MSLAGRGALLAFIVGLLLAAVPVVLEGPSLTALAAVGGLAVFSLGLLGGHGAMVVSGLTVTGLSAALSTDESTLGLIVLVGVGVGVCVALLATDLSWWLRRRAAVDPAVLVAVARAALPAWGFGVVAALGVLWLIGRGEWTVWLLPVAIVATAGLIAAAAELTRRRLARPGP